MKICFMTTTTTTTTMMIMMIMTITLIMACGVGALQMPKFGSFFKANPGVTVDSPLVVLPRLFDVAGKKKDLLKAVSFTANGKDATPEQQARVLTLVAELEENCPVRPTLLSDKTLIKQLDGTWFLQYTSPSKIDGIEDIPSKWEPEFASEGESNIPTKVFKSKGTVSAGGITVDTSNRVVKQIFNVEESSVFNEIELNFGIARVGGKFRQSPNVQKRALVSFNEASITFENGVKLDLGWLFGILAVVRGSEDNGWLETTYLDSDLRIGRGNKGTMFVLTRDVEAVQP